MHLISLASFLTLVTVAVVIAHPGEEHEHIHPAEVRRRTIEVEARRLKARNCADAIVNFELRRRNRRMPLARRQTASSTSSAVAPHYSTIQNTTCVTATEVTEGPYYINNEFVRSDLRESQSGIKLVLDIGVIDTTTCEPFSNAFVELWHANSTGAYGGYVGPQGSPSTISVDTFLRGGYFTNAEGIVEITTIYPGYYTGRTAHIHTMVHKNAEKNSNGQIVSSSGTLTHVGQFFFDEAWNDEVFAVSPYNGTSQQRVLNSQDGILAQAGDAGFLSLQLLGSSISDGVLGYITVAVDGSKAYSIANKNSLSASGSQTATASIISASTSSISLQSDVASD